MLHFVQLSAGLACQLDTSACSVSRILGPQSKALATVSAVGARGFGITMTEQAGCIPVHCDRACIRVQQGFMGMQGCVPAVSYREREAGCTQCHVLSALSHPMHQSHTAIPLSFSMGWPCPVSKCVPCVCANCKGLCSGPMNVTREQRGPAGLHEASWSRRR